MKTKQKDFTTAEAAEYVGMKLPTFQHHVFTAKNVKGTMRGHSLFFKKEALDKFKSNPTFRIAGRRPGQPNRIPIKEDHEIVIITSLPYWSSLPQSTIDKEMKELVGGRSIIGYRKTRKIEKGLCGIGYFHNNPALFKEFTGKIQVKVKK